MNVHRSNNYAAMLYYACHSLSGLPHIHIFSDSENCSNGSELKTH